MCVCMCVCMCVRVWGGVRKAFTRSLICNRNYIYILNPGYILESQLTEYTLQFFFDCNVNLMYVMTLKGSRTLIQQGKII